MTVIALKNIYDGTGKDMKLLVPKDMIGEIVNRYEWGPHKYIIVRFENGYKEEFGDESHPLISYKRFIGVYDEV